MAGMATACLLLSSAAAWAQSSIANIYPNGNYQFQYSPTLSFTASSPAGVTAVTVQLTVINLATGSSFLQNLSLGNGLSTTGAATAYTVSANLNSNTLYSAVIQVTDAGSSTASSTVSFDTISPSYTWEAEDWDFTSNGISGLWIPNPQTNQYAGLASTEGSDFHSSNPGSGGSSYRPQGLSTEGEGDIARQAYIGTTNADFDIGFNNGGSWMDYTRNYPAGTYNLYLRGSGGNGPQADAASLAVAGGTASINGAGPYQFSIAGKGWQTYTWCPLMDSSSGQMAQITLDGSPSTLRVTIDHGNCNENFYMLVPLNTNVMVSTITLTNITPDGSQIYNTDSVFSVTAASPTAPVNPANIFMIVTATNVWGHGSVTTLSSSSGLTITGPSTNLTATFPLVSNTIYKVVIQATDIDGLPTSATVSFDTIVAPPVMPVANANYSFEAEDFNYGGGGYVDNPQTNAYYGLDGSSGIDFNLTAAPQSTGYIRAGLNTEPAGDKVRPAYNATTNEFGIPYQDYDVGFTAGGQWGDYTRNYPAGTYNIYVRAADGGGQSADSGSIAVVISDPHQSGQSITKLGTFSVPGTGNWQSYTWAPVLDAQGHLARFNGGSLETLRATTDGGNYNANFYLLVPADPSVHPLPSVSNFTPDGTALFQYTNSITFTANSSIGLSTTGITMTLNGANVTPSLSFSGTPIEWSVSAPVKPNGFYTAIVTLTDANGTASTTNVFGTYSATNFQWEAEDYDYSNGVTGGLYFDNQVGAYAGLAGQTGVDFNESDPNGPGRGNSYRLGGLQDFPDAVAGDQARAQFTTAGKTDYNLGSFGPFSWANYTHHYPPGTYNVIGRFAEGAANTHLGLSQLVSGYQTPVQTTNFIGTFSIPVQGWSTWEWAPLLDNSGKMAQVTLDGSQQTLQLGGSPNSTEPEANVNFFMLVATIPSPKITVTIVGHTVNVSFPTQTGYTYQLLYKNNLTDATWTPVDAPVSGDWTGHTLGDTMTGTTRFYQIQVQ